VLFLLTNAIPIWIYSIVCRARKCIKNRRDIERFQKEQSTIYGATQNEVINYFGRENTYQADHYEEDDF
jgi:hypothetical protein